MKVKELKEALAKADDDNDVVICVNTPTGYVYPDGAVIDVVKACSRGIDWHSHCTILVPKNKLNVANIENWVNGIHEYNK